jgi:ATP-dependent protease HslVU (ClpYQ) peptidase subunit
MTVIVAARVKGDGVVMACDSQITWGWEKLHEERTKVWAADGYAIGSAGCVRTAQVIQHYTNWPKFRRHEDTDLDAFLVKRVVPAVREALANTGTISTEGGIESSRATLIVAWGKNLATVAGNWSTGRPVAGRAAIGSGYAEALGYLGDPGTYTREQVIEAAYTATKTAVGCDGPIYYITTKELEVRQA